MDILLESGCGPLRGREEEGKRIFRGIPYAVTERFAPPVRVESFAPFAGADGVLDATGPETDCYQLSAFRDEAVNDATSAFYHREFRDDGRVYRYAESPMTLSVVSPAEARALPVLVFVHGGGFETGCVSELPYINCAEFAKRGVVYVSVGYRLNVFGLYRSRNYGLMDLVAALEWLRDHIADFGGDPARMSLIGQSAGAMCITDLLLTKRLQGLIQGAVCMSGGGALPRFAAPLSPEKSAFYWDAVLQESGCKNEEELRTVDSRILWEAWYKVSRSKLSNFSTITPGRDGVLIPDIPQKQEKRQEDLPVPLIIGVCSRDMMAPLMYEIALRRGLRAARIGYPAVYGYFFDRALPGDPHSAFHACDLWYMFGHMDKCWRPFGEADFALSAQMIDYIANFVKTGDPNAEGLPEWPALGRGSRVFRRFDVAGKTLIRPGLSRWKTLHGMLFEKGPM